MEIETVGVVGAGTMGHGIAQVLARSGYKVLLADASAALVANGKDRIERNLARDVEKGRLAAGEREQTLARIETSPSLERMAAVDFVIEAITENFDAKAQV